MPRFLMPVILNFFNYEVKGMVLFAATRDFSLIIYCSRLRSSTSSRRSAAFSLRLLLRPRRADSSLRVNFSKAAPYHSLCLSFEEFHFISQVRCLLELQIFRSECHLVFQLLDQSLLFILRQLAVIVLRPTERQFAVFFRDITHGFFDRLWRDAVRGVVILLHGTSPVGFVDCGSHRGSHPIRVERDMAVQVPRSSADGLNQGISRSEEALFICIQNRDE